MIDFLRGRVAHADSPGYGVGFASMITGNALRTEIRHPYPTTSLSGWSAGVAVGEIGDRIWLRGILDGDPSSYWATTWTSGPLGTAEMAEWIDRLGRSGAEPLDARMALLALRRSSGNRRGTLVREVESLELALEAAANAVLGNQSLASGEEVL